MLLELCCMAILLSPAQRYQRALDLIDRRMVKLQSNLIAVRERLRILTRQRREVRKSHRHFRSCAGTTRIGVPCRFQPTSRSNFCKVHQQGSPCQECPRTSLKDGLCTLHWNRRYSGHVQDIMGLCQFCEMRVYPWTPLERCVKR